MLGLMLVIGLANIAWAERLTIHGGFGWDGVRYAQWARDFYDSVFVQGVPEYYARRILPSAVVHYGLRLFGVPLEDRNIVQGFDIYNLLLLLAAVGAWGGIADRLRMRNEGKWLGFCFLFVNYAILKNNVYHAVLTDTSAFTLGLLMVYFFLADRPIGLLTVIIAGAFTWPTLPYMAALLYVFPCPRGPAASSPRPAPPRYNMHTWLAVSVCLLAALGYWQLLQPERFARFLLHLRRAVRLDMPLLYPSLALVIAYLFVGVRTAATDGRLFDLRSVMRALSWRRLAVAALALGLSRLVVARLANGEEIGFESRVFAAYTLLSAVAEPLIFLVAHTVYYGPAILLIVLLWRPFCESLGAFGVGLRIVIIANVILAINPQSRQQINAVTAFIVVLTWLLDRAGVTYHSLPWWALLCLVYSKVWYAINTAPMVDDGTMEILLRPPLQNYFMSSGSWMSHEMYLVQGGVVLVTGVLLYVLVTRNLRRMPRMPHQSVDG